MFRPASFQHRLHDFLADSSGAVTVDWVVLTAAVAGLGLASAATVRTGTSALGTDIESALSNAQVASLSCMGDNSAADGFECYTGPTITRVGQTYYMATMPYCSISEDGSGGYCSPSVSYESTSYTMSDGSTYTRNTETSGGSDPVTTWTDSRGNIVDEPPPYEGSNGNSGCWEENGYLVCA